MSRPTIKLKLILEDFEEGTFLEALTGCTEVGIEFRSMAMLGDGAMNRRSLYELNKLCSKDIPGRGPFFEFEEFSQRRFGDHYDPHGVIIGIAGEQWVGLSATSNWQERDFAFNEMTGVVREYRRQGIATALKLLGIRYAKSLGVSAIYTIHDFENNAAIEMNKQLGYVDAD